MTLGKQAFRQSVCPDKTLWSSCTAIFATYRAIVRVIDQLLVIDVLAAYKISFHDDVELLLRLQQHRLASQQQAGSPETTSIEEDGDWDIPTDNWLDMLSSFAAVRQLQTAVQQVSHYPRILARLLLFDYQCLVDKVGRQTSFSHDRQVNTAPPCCRPQVFLPNLTPPCFG